MSASPPAASATPPLGWAAPGAIGLRWALVALLVAADLASKSAVFAWLEGDPRPQSMVFDHHGHARVPIVGEWFAFMISRNPGVAFGQLDQFPYLIVGGRIIAVSFLSWLVMRAHASRLLVTSLVLILAGAVGNLHDNLFIDEVDYRFGRVRDFIDVYFARWDYHFHTFNVADSCITVGAVLLFVSSFMGAEPASTADAGADSDSGVGPGVRAG